MPLHFPEPPSITSPASASESYIEGSRVDISCKANGKPDPDVAWIHNRQVKSSGSKTARLSFVEISKVDAGMYTCRANNSAGHKEKHLSLVVNCK